MCSVRRRAQQLEEEEGRATAQQDPTPVRQDHLDHLDSQVARVKTAHRERQRLLETVETATAVPKTPPAQNALQVQQVKSGHQDRWAPLDRMDSQVNRVKAEMTLSRELQEKWETPEHPDSQEDRDSPEDLDKVENAAPASLDHPAQLEHREEQDKTDKTARPEAMAKTGSRVHPERQEIQAHPEGTEPQVDRVDQEGRDRTPHIVHVLPGLLLRKRPTIQYHKRLRPTQDTMHPKPQDTADVGWPRLNEPERSVDFVASRLSNSKLVLVNIFCIACRIKH